MRGLVSYRPTEEQNAVRINANSALTIDKLTTTSSGVDTVSDTELDLKKGQHVCQCEETFAGGAISD